VRHQPAQTAPAIATRYDKLALRYEASLHVATINIWLRALAAKIF
jgi:transposase